MPVDVYTIVASSVASFVSRVATHPLDTLKTRVQAHNIPGHSRSLVQTALSIIRTESPAAFYRGLPVTLVFSVPGLSTYLAVYDLTKERLSSKFGLPTDRVWNHLASGCAAEVISGLIWTPMEVMKNRLQTESMIYRLDGVMAAGRHEMTATRTAALARHIWREGGLRGFFKGYFLALAVFVPYTMTYFSVYEQLKAIAQRRQSPTNPPSLSPSSTPLSFQTYLICSALACTLAASLSNVLDVVKTRWQISTSQAGELERGYRTSPREIMRRMWREEGGWRAFTRGMGARVAWAVPATTISMTCFEVLKDRREWVLGKAEMAEAADQ